MVEVVSDLPREQPDAQPVAFVEPFDAFFLREYTALVALATALGGPAGAEDIAQDALLRAYRDWEKISRYDKPGAWVRRVAINLATSAGRRRRSERDIVNRLSVTTESAVPALNASAEAFWAEVRQLPRRQAAVVALHYMEDRSVAEIAAVLEVAPGTVKAHLHAARATLARRLGAEETEEQS